MPLPDQPVTLNVEQIGELKKKLANLSHDVNNNLAMVVAAAEIIRRKPETAERMWGRLAERPHKIAEALAQFSRELEAALGITRP